MPSILLTAPAVEPIALAEMKAFLRVTRPGRTRGDHANNFSISGAG